MSLVLSRWRPDVVAQESRLGTNDLEMTDAEREAR